MQRDVKSHGLFSTVLYFVYFHGFFFLCILGGLVIIVGPFIFPGTIGLFLALPYITYIYAVQSELTTGNPWPWFSQNFFIWNHIRRMLQLEFVDFPPQASTQQCLYACHPHGVYSDYRVLIDGMLSSRVTHPPKTLAASILFRLPVVREISLWTGCIDARRQVAEAALHRGDSILVLPGGEAEQIRTQSGREIVYLRERKGFIKLALRKGVPVVPMYAFGVSDYYVTSKILFGIRLWVMKNFQICLPLAAGLCGSPFCPLPKKTTIVFGEPMKFEPCGEDPAREQLDTAHGRFVDALTKLFDKHKDRLGYGDRVLEII